MAPTNVTGTSSFATQAAVGGDSTANGTGVHGKSADGFGVHGAARRSGSAGHAPHRGSGAPGSDRLPAAAGTSLPGRGAQRRRDERAGLHQPAGAPRLLRLHPRQLHVPRVARRSDRPERSTSTPAAGVRRPVPASLSWSSSNGSRAGSGSGVAIRPVTCRYTGNGRSSTTA